MRGLLAELEQRQKGQCQDGDFPCPHDEPGYTAWAVIPTCKGGNGSFEAKGSDCRIVWVSSDRYDGPEGIYDDSIVVPRAMARSFGGNRDFRSLEELNAALAMLYANVSFERVKSFCSARERSTSNIKKRLLGEGYPSDVAERALERAVSCGIADDGRFAESYVASKVRSGWGRSRIERGLAENGIDPYLCLTGYPGSYFDVEDEAERARELLARRSLPVKNPIEKLARFLVTRGFEPSVALRLAREEVAARTADELL